MIHYIYKLLTNLLGLNYKPVSTARADSNIWVKDVNRVFTQKGDDNTFIFIKQETKKPIDRQYDDYRTNKFLQEIKTFTFKNKKKNINI